MVTYFFFTWYYISQSNSRPNLNYHHNLPLSSCTVLVLASTLSRDKKFHKLFLTKIMFLAFVVYLPENHHFMLLPWSTLIILCSHWTLQDRQCCLLYQKIQKIKILTLLFTKMFTLRCISESIFNPLQKVKMNLENNSENQCDIMIHTHDTRGVTWKYFLVSWVVGKYLVLSPGFEIPWEYFGIWNWISLL